MSASPNHRRGHRRIQERGPRWEHPDPSKGCNATHVARARRRYRVASRRAVRRNTRLQLRTLLLGVADAER